MAREPGLISGFIDAAVKDPPQAIRLFQEHPELRDARWLHDETVLHFLAVEGQVEAVRLLGSLGFDANAPNKFGDPPLIDVATLGNDKIAEVLLGFGADPNSRSDAWENALHAAVHSGSARLVHLLLSAGAKPDYVTDIGETVFDALPQDLAQRAAIVKVLEEHYVYRPS
jgi:ankyrin repeat protein